ncbi:MAG: hypothetical protein JW751_30445 [Polyangiaceae bacterium]|nr:hypothetical protein [Polyangiaceae bacterium]
MTKLLASSISVLVFGALITACGGKGGATGGAAPSGKPLDIPRCPADGMIDDGEDGNNKILEAGGRGGYWYTAADASGTTITPQAGELGGTFVMTEGGANGSGFAACMKGNIPENVPKPFAVVGFSFVDPPEAFDASKYGGIAFWAKRGPGSTAEVLRLKIPDVNTDKRAGVCEECFNDFGMDITLTEGWVEYALLWPDAKQMPYWGQPKPPAITPEKLYGVQWQIATRNVSYEVCVDDVAFIGCAR